MNTSNAPIPYRDYLVTVTADTRKHLAAWNDEPAYYIISATSQSKAISIARKKVWGNGWTPHDGPNIFRARLATAEDVEKYSET